MAKLKKGSSAWHRSKCVEIAKTLAKIRDKYTCQRCGKTNQVSQIQGSHVYTEKSYPNISADLHNIKALCAYCHRFWWHSEPMEAKKWFEEKFPKRAKRLLEIKNNLKIDWPSLHDELKKTKNEKK